METIFENKDWAYLSQKYDWVRDMEHVPQDTVFHAEGNVGIHTRMVLDALINLPEYQELKDYAKEYLFAAALMHDIEKRSTTIVVDGEIRSPNHAKKGAMTVRQILYRDIPVKTYIREVVCNLVRYHGFPLWSLDKNDAERETRKICYSINPQWLYILAKADVIGRECSDKESLLERVEFFKAFCQDLKCWELNDRGDMMFENDWHDMHYFNSDAPIEYVPYEEKEFSTVTIMCALPGSGKDRWIEQNCKDLPVISLDDIRRKNKIDPTDKKGNGRVIQEAKLLAKQYLAKKQDFVWNATNITSQMRKQLIDLFIDYGAYTRLVIVEVPYKQLLKQNRNREYPIPEKVLEKLINKWEFPNDWEVHETEWVNE